MSPKKRCSKCGGKMFLERSQYDLSKWELTCLNCGWRPPPEKLLTEIIPDASHHFSAYKVEGTDE